jgi:hypothetical protein
MACMAAEPDKRQALIVEEERVRPILPIVPVKVVGGTQR